MLNLPLSLFAIIAIVTLAVVYYFLISEKIPKTVVVILGSSFLIVTQVFRTISETSQENAFHFIAHNLDILGFVIGMMILVGIVKESGFFEAVAISLVKVVRGNPKLILVTLSYLTLVMTMFFSNIPTVLIIIPVVLILIRQLKLPYMPFLLAVVTMANIGGAATPISDPTTYYQAKTVGLGFMEVLSNSGLIVLACSVITMAYILIVFNKQLSQVKVDEESVAEYRPMSAIKNKKIAQIGIPLLVLTIVLMIGRETIHTWFGITLDNATIAMSGAFLAIFLFHKEPGSVLRNLIDWEIIFFFIGLFIVVGALEFTHVIDMLAQIIINFTQGNLKMLTAFITIGSAGLSTFIDNVPYNIAMVGAVQAMEKSGIWVYPLWWGLNVGTSIGGAGSPIGAACNVLSFGQAEKDGIHINFGKYLIAAFPLVILNSLTAFAIIYFRYL